MLISAALCTRDRPTFVADCLSALLACDYQPREVLVVDQSADGRTRDVVAQSQGKYPELRYVPTETRGLSASRNLASREARGDVVAFTDDDCLADAGWLGALAAEFGADPTVAAVCGRSLALVESPLVAHAAAVHPSQERRLFRGRCSPWRIGSGNNMAVRTSALRAIGPFDERLGPGARFHGGEESDMLYRLLASGRAVLYSPRPLVYHRQWRDRGQQLGLSYRYGVGIGAFGAKQVRNGDVLPLRTLAGWSLAGLRDIAASLSRRDTDGAISALRLLAGLGIGFAGMALTRSPRS